MRQLIAYRYETYIESSVGGQKSLGMHSHVSSDIVDIAAPITEEWKEEFQKSKAIEIEKYVNTLPNSVIKDVFVTLLSFSAFHHED